MGSPELWRLRTSRGADEVLKRVALRAQKGAKGLLVGRAERSFPPCFVLFLSVGQSAVRGPGSAGVADVFFKGSFPSIQNND